MAQSNNKSGGSSTTSSTGNGGGGRVSSAYESARSGAATAGRKLSDNPVGALVGGFAVGAVIGAVVPATRRERDALAPIGSKINDAARNAARQAAETGRDKLNRITGEVVTQVGSKVVDAVGGSPS
jgi:hypothetical protein